MNRLPADAGGRPAAVLSLMPEPQRGHGALCDAVNQGRIGITRLRRVRAGRPLSRAADGRLMLAMDVSNWLRPFIGVLRRGSDASHGKSFLSGPRPNSLCVIL
jgi:hypothetical protein